jgi:hypothetical protein
LVNKLGRTVLNGTAPGLIAVVITVIVVGLITSWASTHRPRFVRAELAWFGFFSILSGLQEWSRAKGLPARA